MTATLRIEWSENSEVHRRRGVVFDELAEIDRAISAALCFERPPAGGAYDKTGIAILVDGEVATVLRADLDEADEFSAAPASRHVLGHLEFLARSPMLWVKGIDERRSLSERACEILAELGADPEPAPSWCRDCPPPPRYAEHDERGPYAFPRPCSGECQKEGARTRRAFSSG